MATFGNSSVGSSWDSNSASFAVGSKFTLSSSGAAVTKLSMYLEGNGADQKLRGLIYAADGGGGAPGTFKAASSEVTVTASQAAGWVDFPVTVTLAAGDYWLLFWTGATGSGAAESVTNGVGTAGYAALTYASTGNPGTLGTWNAETLNYSIYATYTTGGGGMLVTNQTIQDYWFGPLHLLGGVGQTLTVDDTSDTSLYLTDDSVADAINNLYASGKINVTGAATPFPRPTGMPTVVHGDGSPEGIVYAPQGSLYLRRDGADAWHLYVKTTAVTINTGWVALPGQELDYAQITSNPAGITATTEGTSQTVISGNQVYYDGSRVKVSLFVPKLTSSASLTVTYVIYRDSTVIGQVFGGTVNTTLQGTDFEIFDTPAAGAHTYAVKAFVSAGTLTVNAGAGGSGNLVPGWLRITKA